MELNKENVTRKIDSMGRVAIPKSMRDRLEMREGDEVEFYLLKHDTGEYYVCFTNHKGSKDKYAIAADVLNELDIEIPIELREML